MNPLIKSPKHFAAFLAAWLPVMAGMTYLGSQLALCSLRDAAILLVPALVIQMFFFSGVWYVARATAVKTGNLAVFLMRHGLSYIVMNAVWLYMIMLYAEFLNAVLEQEVWRQYFTRMTPLLITAGFIIYFVAALISYLSLANERAREAEVETMENKLKAGEAELKFLKASLHPHFMFNSLNALSTLTVSQPEKAQKVCLQLADFLRYSLSFKDDIVPLGEELEHIRNYLSIEKTRLGQRLRVAWDVEPGLEDEPLLSFCLQPLVENAVKHGIEPRLDGGVINISIKRNQTHLLLELNNPLPEEAETARPSTGQGLLNLKARLNQAYNNTARMVAHRGGKAFAIKLYLPLIKNDV